jgi:hypothetical protein
MYEAVIYRGHEIIGYEDDFEHGFTVYNKNTGFYAEVPTYRRAKNLVDRVMKAKLNNLRTQITKLVINSGMCDNMPANVGDR